MVLCEGTAVNVQPKWRDELRRGDDVFRMLGNSCRHDLDLPGGASVLPRHLRLTRCGGHGGEGQRLVADLHVFFDGLPARGAVGAEVSGIEKEVAIEGLADAIFEGFNGGSITR